MNCREKSCEPKLGLDSPKPSRHPLNLEGRARTALVLWVGINVEADPGVRKIRFLGQRRVALC
jgi:hypothetical protein